MNCDCSRKDWQAVARMGVDGFVYNGKCASLNPLRTLTKAPAWRLRVGTQIIKFNDAIVGCYQQQLAQDVGDFVLFRADGYWAYQLAVVVDDAEQGVTHVVRGQDLLVSTPRQISNRKIYCLRQFSIGKLKTLLPMPSLQKGSDKKIQ